jgi:preprotein translocase subunit SecD
MNEPGRLIADALRGIGEQASKPRLRIDAAWRAGRRRRLRARAASAAGAAGVAAAAVLVPLALTSGPTHPGPGPAAQAPLLLATPIQIGQIAAISHRSPAHCRVERRQLPDTAGKLCFQLTRTGMTVLGVKSVHVTQSPAGGSMLIIRFTQADAHSFANLTRRLASLPDPRCQLAVVVSGKVVFHATVQSPITSGEAGVSGISHARAEHLLAELTGS